LIAVVRLTHVVNIVRFRRSLGRCTYVTPTSYLELLRSFNSLITQKQESTMKAKKRYLVGLDKLAFASSQVTHLSDQMQMKATYLLTYLLTD